MTDSKPQGWDRFGDVLLNWGGYALLAIATVLGLAAGDPDPAWRVTTLAIAAVAAAWLYVGYTRRPLPDKEHRVRLAIFFVGLLVLAAALMLRHPLFFVFMIAGFFYATALRPMPLAVAGVFASSILVNTLIAGFPQTPEGWTFYLVIIGIQTVVISVATLYGERVAEQNEERREVIARLEAAMIENAGLHAQLLAQAREAGILDERARMAREIHDTIAQGLIGIVTQLEAADQAHDRPADRDRHLDNAEKLARDSLVEARRSVEASMPAALESATLPDALAEVARDWSGLNGIQCEVAVIGEVIAAPPRDRGRAAADGPGGPRERRPARPRRARVADAVVHGRRGDARRARRRRRVRGRGGGGDEATAGPGAGFGLTGMRQRVTRVAGSLAIESEPGGGTAVSARVPAIAAGTSAVSAS